MADTTIKTVAWDEFKNFEEAGYRLLEGGDASRANSSFFVVMERPLLDGGRNILILCPTFLRGSLGFDNVKGCISY